jgi:hypothetical protein
MRWAGHIAYMGEMINAYEILTRKCKGKKLIGRFRHRWSDNIKTVFIILNFSILFP